MLNNYKNYIITIDKDRKIIIINKHKILSFANLYQIYIIIINVFYNSLFEK